MFLCLLAALASGHPFGAQFAAHRTELWVATDEVAVTYTAEVPLGVVRRNLRRPGEDPVAETERMLQSGLVMHVNGQPVVLRPDPARDASPTLSDDAMRFTLRFRAPLSSAPEEVSLGNANLPDMLAVYNGAITVGPGLLVDDCSLWRTNDRRELIRDETDRWRTESEHRTLTVQLRQPGVPMSLLAAWYRPEPAPRLAGEARTPTAAEVVASPSFKMGVLAMGGLLAGLVALVRRRGRHSSLREAPP